MLQSTSIQVSDILKVPYDEVVGGSEALGGDTVVDGVHLDNAQGFLALFELLLVVVPGECLRLDDH